MAAVSGLCLEFNAHSKQNHKFYKHTTANYQRNTFQLFPFCFFFTGKG